MELDPIKKIVDCEKIWGLSVLMFAMIAASYYGPLVFGTVI